MSDADHYAYAALQGVVSDIERRIHYAYHPPEEEPTATTRAATPTPDTLAANLIAVGEHLNTVANILAAEIATRAGIDTQPPDQELS